MLVYAFFAYRKHLSESHLFNVLWFLGFLCLFVLFLGRVNFFCKKENKEFKTTLITLFILLLIPIKVININWIPKHISLETSKKIKVGVVLRQTLGQIWQNVVKKVNKQVLSIGFFHILHGEYFLQQKVVGLHRLEWKFKAKTDRNATCQLRLGRWGDFCPI